MAAFTWISRPQALAFRDHVRAREPYRLRDLARWMADTGGPIAVADASPDSLVPVWEWFVWFVEADCPGMDRRRPHPYMTAESIPPDWTGPDLTPERRRSRAKVAAVPLEHYVRLVWQRFDPPSTWEIYLTPGRGRLDQIHHSTGIAGSHGEMVTTDIILNLATGVGDNTLNRRRPTTLLEFLHQADFWANVPPQPPGPSVLAPYLTLDLPPEPEQSAISPVYCWPSDYWKAKAGQGEPRTAGEDMTLWRGHPDDLEDDPTRLDPLPAHDLATVLAAHGFVRDDTALDATALLTDPEDGHVALGHTRELGLAELLIADGAIRALHLEPWAYPKSEWNALVKDLRALARRNGARFTTDDRIE